MGKLARKVILILLRGVLGGVFIYAGAMKALDPGPFAAEVENYRLVSGIVAAGFALYLPWLEIFAGLAVLTTVAARGGLVVLAMLLVVFIGALSSAWMRGLNISCGCLGTHFQTSSYALLLGRDWVLLVIAGILSASYFVGSQRQDDAVNSAPPWKR